MFVDGSVPSFLKCSSCPPGTTQAGPGSSICFPTNSPNETGLLAAILVILLVAVLVAFTPVGRFCQSAVTRNKAVASAPAPAV